MRCDENLGDGCISDGGWGWHGWWRTGAGGTIIDPADDSVGNDDLTTSAVPQLPCSNIGSAVGTVYGTTCGNLNQAARVLYNPDSTFGQRLGSGYYISVVGFSHIALVIGLAWAAWEAIIPSSVACATNP